MIGTEGLLVRLVEGMRWQAFGPGFAWCGFPWFFYLASRNWQSFFCICQLKRRFDGKPGRRGFGNSSHHAFGAQLVLASQPIHRFGFLFE